MLMGAVVRKDYWAHLYDGKKEKLITHLENVGELAGCYADAFGCKDIAEQAGRLHDIGKMTEKFQLVLEKKESHIDHSVVGSIYAENDSKNIENAANSLISDAIFAHHTSIPGGIGFDPEEEYHIPENDEECSFATQKGKSNALSTVEEYEKIVEFIISNNLDRLIEANSMVDSVLTMGSIAKMLLQRMILSCLVDADWTATARFEDPLYYDKSRDISLDADILLNKLDTYHGEIVNHSEKTEINSLRNIVYKTASDMGRSLKTGFYSMTAPTGTGKTLALLKFALENAKKNQLSKIFIVLPYLSIIEQNSMVYKNILGDDVVFEDDSQTELNEYTKYFQDRWSCPIIITTSVNFFEMMFKAKAAKLRRLHQISNACVVFDESQTLPLQLTDSSINALYYLSKYFGSTVLFSTATPVPYVYRSGITSVPFEIMSDTKNLYEKYHKAKNTEVIFNGNELTYEEIYECLKNEKQALWVLNTKKKALKLFDYIKDSPRERA